MEEKLSEPLWEMGIGNSQLEAGKSYLWRVAVVHPVFGAGAFSPSTRIEVEMGRAGLAIGKMREVLLSPPPLLSSIPPPRASLTRFSKSC